MSKNPWICALCRSIVSTRSIAGRAQQVRHELGRDRHPRLVLPVLPRVAVVRDHRRDARRRRAPERVDHDAQLDQVLVDRPARRLHDEHVGAADVLVDLERDLRVRKAVQPGLPERHAQEFRDLPRQLRVRAARKQLQLCSTHTVRSARPTARRAAAQPRIGWGGRIRTFECGIQSPVPYRLATPHHRPRSRPPRDPPGPHAGRGGDAAVRRGAGAHQCWKRPARHGQTRSLYEGRASRQGEPSLRVGSPRRGGQSMPRAAHHDGRAGGARCAPARSASAPYLRVTDKRPRVGPPRRGGQSMPRAAHDGGRAGGARCARRARRARPTCASPTNVPGSGRLAAAANRCRARPTTTDARATAEARRRARRARPTCASPTTSPGRAASPRRPINAARGPPRRTRGRRPSRRQGARYATRVGCVNRR